MNDFETRALPEGKKQYQKPRLTVLGSLREDTRLLISPPIILE